MGFWTENREIQLHHRALRSRWCSHGFVISCNYLGSRKIVIWQYAITKIITTLLSRYNNFVKNHGLAAEATSVLMRWLDGWLNLFVFIIESEYCTLDDSCYRNHLFSIHICPTDSVWFFSIFSRVFFWPEENTLGSERIDNAVLFEIQ